MSATVSEELGALKLSDIPSPATSSTGEISLEVPSTFAQHPLGFALDAGGSTTKIVYRSKLDYTAGKPNSGKDVVRLRFFPNGKGDGDELIKFLKDNCDVWAPSPEGATDTDGRPLYHLTGVGIQHFKEKLEEAFNCRIKIMPEIDAGVNGILHVTNLISQLKQFVPVSVEAADSALHHVRDFMAAMQGYREAGIQGFGDVPPPSQGIDIPTYVMKLMTTNGAALAEEFSAKSLTYPCVLVQCGSATGSVIVRK